ncbi:MAG: Gfo/Idh/MocA family oxidoreductase [Acidimicrobiia bacterium]|nr:Gfo/Idh/MocA family oxidoreductase [Acidimicrobiia bacterium]
MTDQPIDPPLRWGILSTAAIAAEHVVPALQSASGHEVVAVGSRNLQRATQWGAEHDIASVHGSYDELLADENVEAIYNPLPNHLHVDWSIAALEAGKHVLCEKPLGLDANDARRLLDAAANHPDLVVMEAFMYRFHPQWIAARELISDGRVGELRTVQTFFSYYNDDPDNVRNDAGIGGGALLDIGCYPISQARFLFDREPERALGLIERDPTFETDRISSAVLDFGGGCSATFTVSTQLHGYQRALLVGTTGRIEIDIPVNSPKDRATALTVVTDGGETDVLSFGPVDQYASQADAFGAAIRAGQPAPTPLADAIANMTVIDAVFASAAHDRWQPI